MQFKRLSIMFLALSLTISGAAHGAKSRNIKNISSVSNTSSENSSIGQLLHRKVSDILRENLNLSPEAQFEMHFYPKTSYEDVVQHDYLLQKVDLIEMVGKNNTFRIEVSLYAENDPADEDNNIVGSQEIVEFDDTPLRSARTVRLTGEYKTFFNVPIASRVIKKDTEIGATDLKIVKIYTDAMSGDIALKESDILGMQARNIIGNGQYFLKSVLKMPPVIKGGDNITLMYKSGAITIKTVGIALNAGAVGDKIQAKNEKSGSAVFGEVIAKDTVLISDDTPAVVHTPKTIVTTTAVDQEDEHPRQNIEPSMQALSPTDAAPLTTHETVDNKLIVNEPVKQELTQQH